MKLLHKNKLHLSVVLATRDEEENIGRCLESVKKIAGEIIIVDEYSKDKTKQIAKNLGAKIYLEPHHDIFHITKQIALEKATGDWILQLDADEVVTPKLAEEIKEVVTNKTKPIKPSKLFLRHQTLLEARDLPAQAGGKSWKDTGEIVGYFIPRRNMFLGKPLIHAGVYPDGVIRLVKNGFAKFPQKSVHEQIEINGRVGWLKNDLLHFDSPTLKKYFWRLNRYTDLKAQEFKESKTPKNFWSFLRFTILHPTYYFLLLFIRHKGFLDGVNGFLWSFLSALHFPVAYFKYVTEDK